MSAGSGSKTEYHTLSPSDSERDGPRRERKVWGGCTGAVWSVAAVSQWLLESTDDRKLRNDVTASGLSHRAGLLIIIIIIITSEREARSEFLLIYTKNLSMSGRPARRPAGPLAVVTLLGGLYLWNRKPD